MERGHPHLRRGPTRLALHTNDEAELSPDEAREIAAALVEAAIVDVGRPAPGIPAQPDGEGRLVVNISVDATEKVADAMGVSVVELYRLATQQRPRPSVRAGALSSRAFEGYEPGWHAHQPFGPM